MALKLEQKKTIVASVAEMASRSSSLIVVTNNGLPMSDMTRLRSKAREIDVHLRVARNTLVERALKGSPFECMNESLVGPVLLVFGGDELSAGARLIQDFTKTNDKLVVKSLSLGGKVLDAKQLALVASLPTRSEAIAKLLAVMQAPIAKFVQTLAAPTSKFVRTLAAVRDQKQ
ncbi:MAG: 50S ribosomal protein L10 [Gammaproteobacteria bacterium]|nr:50S ribosomal protein L10 [Gammaproteobacteria bacterium]